MNQPTQSSPTSGGSGLAPNVASLLCYICGFVTGIIFLLIEKDNKDVKFHAWQSILLGGGFMAFYLVMAIFISILATFSLALAGIFTAISWLVWLAVFIVMIVCMVKAYQGQRWKVPYLGDIAEKQAAK